MQQPIFLDAGAALGKDGACKSTLEIFSSALNSNPVGNWRFWIVTLTASALTLFVYRNYYRANSGTASDSDPSLNTSL